MSSRTPTAAMSTLRIGVMLPRTVSVKVAACAPVQCQSGSSRLAIEKYSSRAAEREVFGFNRATAMVDTPPCQPPQIGAQYSTPAG